jgi:2-oxoglutarate ferredoxin oxidoreductase subunit beta
LSPCVTFRPEQKDWKHKVRPSARSVQQDRAAATALALGDDGFSVGALFCGDRAPSSSNEAPTATLAEIERKFVITVEPAR